MVYLTIKSVDADRLGNLRVKASLIPHLTQAVALGAELCPKPIIKLLLPFALEVAGEKKGGITPLAAQLVRAMQQYFGSEVAQALSTLPAPQKQAVLSLLG